MTEWPSGGHNEVKTHAFSECTTHISYLQILVAGQALAVAAKPDTSVVLH